MNKKILVSVIIPTYNRLDYLKECLESLINQTADKHIYEIIVVDDGSKDRTKEYLFGLQEKQKYPNIYYYKQKNQGPAEARNTGVRHAKGKYLAFTDSDCRLEKNWIKNILLDFKETNADMIGGYELPISDMPVFQYVDNVIFKNAIKTKSVELSLVKINPDNFIVSNNMVVKKKVFLKERGFNRNKDFYYFGEDSDITYRFLINSKRVIRCNNLLIKHYQRQNLLQLLKRSYMFGLYDVKTYKTHFKNKFILEGLPIINNISLRLPLSARIQINTFKMILLGLILLFISPIVSLIFFVLIILLKTIRLKNFLAAVISIYTDALIQGAKFFGNIVGVVRYKILCI